MNSSSDIDGEGRVLLFTGGDPIAALVKWQSRSKYSHAALLPAHTNTIVESYPFAGVRKRTLIARDWERIHAFKVRGMTVRQWQAAVSWAESQLGCEYDWRNVLRFVSRLPGVKNHRWFCSELVFKAIEKTHLRLLQMPAEYVDPGHLATSPHLQRDCQFELMMQAYFDDSYPN